MEKVVEKISNFKFDDVPSGITNSAQRQQQQHAAEQGGALPSEDERKNSLFLQEN